MTREEERLGEALKFYDKHKSAASNVTLVDSFVYGTKWADKTMIDKACEWLISAFDSLHNEYGHKLQFVNKDVFVEAFKKAMEE